MRYKIAIALLIASISSTVGADSIEAEILEIAKREYPNDAEMRDYIYKQQFTAYNYIQTVGDEEVLEIAKREYPHDYSMQKYTYDQQVSAKRYMGSVEDQELKEYSCLLYTSPSPRDQRGSRMPSSA